MIVLDASVAVKWFIQQPGWEAAEGVLRQYIGQIAVPDLFGIEVAATLVREANIDKTNLQFSRNSVAQLATYLADGALQSHPLLAVDLAKAANLAIDLGHPLKDCLYLALAIDLACPLVTCDAKFAAKACGVYAGVRVLGE